MLAKLRKAVRHSSLGTAGTLKTSLSARLSYSPKTRGHELANSHLQGPSVVVPFINKRLAMVCDLAPPWTVCPPTETCTPTRGTPIAPSRLTPSARPRLARAAVLARTLPSCSAPRGVSTR